METKSVIKISPPVRHESADKTSLSFQISGMDEPELHFRIDSSVAPFVTNRSDPALVALLAPAMYARKDIHLEGTVSEKLLCNINRYVIPLLLEAIRGTYRIRVTASSVSPAPNPKPGAVITGLSNGVDSLSVCKDYLLSDDIPASMRITHFLFSDVGSHGQKKNSKSSVMHESRSKGVQHAARSLDVPLIGLQSNLDLFYTTAFVNTHTLRNAAAALTLQAGARYFLYASAYPYRKIKVGLNKELGKIDPILLPLLSTEGLEMFSAGAAYSRAEKTRLISEMEVAKRHLDVCVVSNPNCSTCWKCSRTLLTLDLLGKLDQFSAVFNLSKYRRIRKGYIAHVVASRDDNAFCMEIFELMQKTNMKFGLSQALRNIVARALYKLVAAIRIRQVSRAYKRVTYFFPEE